MADKKETSKIVLERVYNIPVRKQTLKVPNFKKANKAMKTIREFIERHMKPVEVSYGKYLNQLIWKHGAKNPPHHLKVTASKDDKGKVTVELVGAPKEKKTEEKKKAVKKEEKTVKEAEFKEKPEEKLEQEIEKVHDKKAEDAKKIEKEEIKEMKKEHPKQHHPQKIPTKPRGQELRKKEMIPEQGH